MNTENHGGMISTGEYSLFVHQSSLVIAASSHLVANQEELGERNDKFDFRNILFSYFEVIFNRRKILGHGADGFTSPPKEGVLRIFISVKNPSPRHGLHPMAITLTSIPPRSRSTALNIDLSTLSDN